MRAELKREEARSAFYEALASFQATVPHIDKARVANVRPRNGSAYSYRYADLAGIQRAIAPALVACGLSVTFDTAATPGGFLVTCNVHHIAGHSACASFPVPIDTAGRMNPAQAAGSALTYGRRYALCAALGIVTAEDDDDAQGADPEPFAGRQAPSAQPAPAPQQAPNGYAPPVQSNGAPITEAQHRRLEARITELGLDRERVKAWVSRAWGIEHLTQIHQADYDDLDRRLTTWAGIARAEAAARGAAPERADPWLADYSAAHAERAFQ